MKMELVIKIPEEVKQAFDCAESNDLKGGYYDHGGIIGEAIKNGRPLPKGHGRLKDVDELDVTTDDYSGNDVLDVVLKDDIDDALTIIEADRESEDK